MAKTTNKTIQRRLAGAWLSSVISISLVLMLIGVAAIVGVNARRVSDYFKEHLQMEVVMKQEVGEKQAAEFATELQSRPYVNSANLITREQGKKELEEMLGKDFLDVFESTLIPISIELTLKADYVNADSLALVGADVMKSPLVDDVESRGHLVDVLNSNIASIALVLGVLTLLLLFISFILIGNTVRLNVFSRRFTVHAMQLVGASRAFIRRPFMRFAVIMGLAASALAIIGLAVGGYLIMRNFPQLYGVFTPGGLALVAGVILVCGVGICLVSTFFSVNRLTGMDKDQLYY